MTKLRSTVGYLALAVAALATWELLHAVAGASLLPGPVAVMARAVELWASGQLQEHVSLSAERLFVGWAIGCAIAVPLGLLMAQIPIVRRVVDPYLQFCASFHRSPMSVSL